MLRAGTSFTGKTRESTEDDALEGGRNLGEISVLQFPQQRHVQRVTRHSGRSRLTVDVEAMPQLEHLPVVSWWTHLAVTQSLTVTASVILMRNCLMVST